MKTNNVTLRWIVEEIRLRKESEDLATTRVRQIFDSYSEYERYVIFKVSLFAVE
jgi:hypothetical protein